MLRLAISGGFVATLLILSSVPATAGTVTYYFAGTIDSTQVINASLPSDVHTGASFTGTLVYDDSTAPNYVAATSKAYDALQNLVVNIGASSFSMAGVFTIYGGGHSSYIQTLYNNPAGGSNLNDSFVVAGSSYDYTQGTQQRNAQMVLDLRETSVSPHALTSRDLSAAVLDLSKFPTSHEIYFADTNINSITNTFNSDRYFHGNITALSQSPIGANSVPEPATVVSAVTAALIGVAAYRRRKSAV